MNDINKILAERGARYGDFKTHARITQRLKSIININIKGRTGFNDYHLEALDMIAHKLGRIINGDPNYIDSWADIAGYAQLIVKELEKENNANTD